MAEKKEKSGGNYIVATFFAAILWIPLTRWIMPDMIPMFASDVWDSHGTTVTDWLILGWPIFAWGVGLNFFLQMFAPRIRRINAAGIFVKGTIISLFAGITEEIAFRWLLFFGGFLALGLTNWLFFGWLGLGLPELFFTHIWAPLANFTTFGYLEPWLCHESGWLFGGALLSANAFFRDGHKYQGLLGISNSWFLGMFFFYVMFTHGLWAAMFIHFMYDFLIFSSIALIHAIFGR